MVKKKNSRAASSRRKVPIQDNSDEESKVNLEKRLDDFDRQVEERVKQMEADKESFIAITRNIFYMDQQRTSSDTNKMLWTDYLKQKTDGAKVSTIRNSIDTLITKAELELKSNRGKRKRMNVPVFNDPPSEGIRRSNRLRGTTKVLYDSQHENFPIPAVTNKGKGKKKELFTPANQSKDYSNSMLITPKFDLRTPIPLGTMRRRLPGELTVSLKGSPILNSKVHEVISACNEENLDEESLKALQLLQKKLTQNK